MKKDKNGFKVVNSSQVYVSKGTPVRPKPRNEVIALIRNIWNDDSNVKKMKKYIRKLSIQTRISSNGQFINCGKWVKSDKKVIIYDHSDINFLDYKKVFYHEIVGHAFWNWAEEYRPEEWKEFNEYVKNLKPITNYVRINANKWKNMFERADISYSLYEDEQHSAAVEVVNGLSDEGLGKCLLTEEEVTELKKVYEKLHY
jgi:hypothetical protein